MSEIAPPGWSVRSELIIAAKGGVRRKVVRLEIRGTSEGTLADGSRVSFDAYDATVLWDGELRVVLVDEADTTPLVGMQLLDRHNLNIDVESGGRVLIQAKA